MKRKNCLITGGAGFIGGALARSLAADGHSVAIIDLPEKIHGASHWITSPNMEIYPGDVSISETFSALPEREWNDVFHLAAQTSARVSEELPLKDIDTNVKGALNLCNWARKVKPTRVIFTSSMAVYGWNGDNIDEKREPMPVSVYGVTKLASENFFRILLDDGIPTQVYRLFNVYGPGQDFFNLSQGMLSIYLAQALTKPEILVTGSLDRYRDFVYVDDVVSALRLSVPKGTPHIMNVGNGQAVRVDELLEQIIASVKQWNPDVKVRQLESHRGDVFGNFANINSIKAAGWMPKTDLASGLMQTLIDARKVLKCE